MPKFGRTVPYLRCDSHTSFKVKRSNIRVRGGWGIPSLPNPAATLLIIIIIIIDSQYLELFIIFN